ncbi:hypothetical protein FB446DRAFT_774043 [Lentinula raphanica]|nr:hypothetical protein FB446DRAFT_774043 [Lentinula raphanica]
MRSSVMNLAFFVGLSIFTLSTCRPMPGAGPSKPGTSEPEPGVSLKSDSTWTLVNPEGVQEPTGRSSSPTPADTEHVHQFFSSGQLTGEEQQMVNAAKEFGDQTNRWDGFKFKINWDSKIPVERSHHFVTAEIRSSASNKDDKNIRGKVSLACGTPDLRDNAFYMEIRTGGMPNQGTEKEFFIDIGYAHDGRAEFARTEEGKITVIPKKTKS